MLGFSEDGEGLAEFVDGFDDFRAGLGKLVPIHVRVLSDCFENGVEVFLNGGNVNLAHVEKIIL